MNYLIPYQGKEAKHNKTSSTEKKLNPRRIQKW
jgi:hypothetical protein